MKTIKIIDLLNMISKGEEVPEKIFYAEQYWINKYPNDYEGLGYGGCLLNNVCLNNLNDEVEILEEEKKIPEKLETYKENDDEGCYANILKVSKNGEYEIDEATSVIIDKINEILDYLETKGNE